MKKTKQNLEQYTWGDNDQDRNFTTPTGIYKQQVSKEYYTYIRPLETGNLTGIRWYQIMNHRGQNLLVKFDKHRRMSDLLFLDTDLYSENEKSQHHSVELNSRKQTQLHTDYAQMGFAVLISWVPGYQIYYTVIN
jgi:beta-galactosidase